MPVNTAWYRFYDVTPYQTGVFDSALIGHYPEQWTHLRSWVTWYIESPDTRVQVEPMCVGVYAELAPTGTTPQPRNPADEGPGYDTDWWAIEVHQGGLATGATGSLERVRWPHAGSRTWDIQTNRRVDPGMELWVWLVWALPLDQGATMHAVTNYSSLIRERT